MSKIKVTCEVQSYDDPTKQSMRVISHWNREEMVVLEFEGKEITVLARHLKAAIDNCTNTGKN